MDQSILDKINDLVIDIDSIQMYHTRIVNKLQDIANRIDQRRVVSDKLDTFHTILDRLHLESLENIEKTGEITFGSSVLDYLNTNPHQHPHL